MKKRLIKGFELYRNMAAPVKASLWFTACNVMNKGIALLSTPILTRIMTTEQYGMFSIYQSWLSILIIFATLNVFLGAYTTGLVRYEKEQRRLESSLLGLTTSLTLALAAAFMAIPGLGSGIFGLPVPLIAPMFLEIVCMTAYEFWSATERFDYQYKKLVVISIFMTAGSLGLGIIAVLSTNYKAEARIYSDVLVKCIVGIFLYVSIMRRGRQFFSLKFWKFGFVFSVPLIPHFLSHFVLGQSDRIMIGRLCGNGEAAIYSVAYSIAIMMSLITNAVNNSFCPYTYKKLKKDDLRGIDKNANILFCLVGGLCIATMAFAPEVIRVFAGPEYYDAVWVIPPVAASVYFIFAYAMFSNIEYYFGRTIGISIASIGCAAANLILNFVFMKGFGYFAAGYTTLLSYIGLAWLHYLMYRKVVREKYGADMRIYNEKIIMLLGAGVIVVMGLMLAIYNYPMVRYGIIALLAASAFWKRKVIFRAVRQD